jgi:hypothetical protein
MVRSLPLWLPVAKPSAVALANGRFPAKAQR